MSSGCQPIRNLTPLFLKFRAARKTKKHRFTSAVLGTSTTLSRGNRSDDDDYSSQRALQGREGLLCRTSIASPNDFPIADLTLQRDVLPPIWVDLVEEANDDISKAKEKLSALQKIQQQRLLRIFGDDDSLQQPERDVEALSVQITEILRRCENRIRQLGASEGSLSESEVKLRQNAQRNIATKLQSVSKQMRLQQQHYISELRRRHQLDNDDSTDVPSSVAGSYEKLAIGGEQELVCDPLAIGQLADLERVSDVRHKEITRIAQSVAELHQLFKDLNALVVDQGTILDRIDYNIEQVVEQSTNATRHVRKAELHQRGGRAGRVILLLVGMIVLLDLRDMLSVE